jgi:hypothetical protein
MQSNGMNVFIRFCSEIRNSFIMKMVLLTPVGHKLFEDTKRVLQWFEEVYLNINSMIQAHLNVVQRNECADSLFLTTYLELRQSC